MRVVEVTQFGGAEVLRPADRPDPEPRPAEVLVAVRATTVNPTDLSTRDGSRRRRMPELEPPFVLGWDLAGGGPETGERGVGMIPFVHIGGGKGGYFARVGGEPPPLGAR